MGSYFANPVNEPLPWFLQLSLYITDVVKQTDVVPVHSPATCTQYTLCMYNGILNRNSLHTQYMYIKLSSQSHFIRMYFSTMNNANAGYKNERTFNGFLYEEFLSSCRIFIRNLNNLSL